MRRIIFLAVLPILLLVNGVVVMADDNPDRDSHGRGLSIITSGKVTSIRAQTEGLEFGTKEDFLDAEILVKLDSAPEMTFGFRYHENASPSLILMADLLKEAYFNGLPVRIFHTHLPKKKNQTIIWVELSK
jgi:hypothetical protein